MLNVPWAKEAYPSKLTDSPLHIREIVSGNVDARATGLWHGVEQVIAAAKVPVPISFEVNTRVKHPEVLSDVQVTTVP